MVKNLPAMQEIPGLTPGSRRFPIKRNGNPLQYSFLENSMVRGAWETTVHRVTTRWIQLNPLILSHK